MFEWGVEMTQGGKQSIRRKIERSLMKMNPSFGAIVLEVVADCNLKV